MKQMALLLVNLMIGFYTYSQCNNTFKLDLRGNGNDVGFDIIEISGGDMIIAGETTSFGAGGKDIFLTRMTRDGQIIWNKYYGGANDEEIRKLKLARDGDLLITGRTKSYGNTAGETMAMKIDINGNIKWSVRLGENSGSSLGLDILNTTDNGFIVCGTNYDNSLYADWLVAKLDNAGNLLWSKRFDNTINEDAFSLIQKADTVIISGNSQASANYYGLLVKMAVSDGTVYNTSSYIIDNRGAFSSKIQYSANEYRVSLHIIDGNSYSQMQEGFVIMDQLFTSKKSFKLAPPLYENFYFTGFWQTSDGGYLVTGSPANGNKATLYKFDQQSNLVYANSFSSATPIKILSATEASDQSVWIIGSENNHIVLMKLNAAGQLVNCPNQPITGNVQPVSLTYPSFGWSSITTFNFKTPGITLSTAGFTFNVDSACFVPVCKAIQLQGVNAVCNLSDTLNYITSKNGACSNSIIWTVPSTAYSKTINDSTVQVNFSTAGTYKIKAAYSGACSILQDSVSVVVKPASSFVQLGNDSVLCNSSMLVLDAGPGFQQYSWQDNSKSQTFTAMKSGTYYVTATNYCGKTLTDTTRLTFRSPNGFAVNPGDTSYCVPSVIQLSATGGDVYSWNPSKYLNDPAISNPAANPDSGILYTVKIIDTICNRSKDLSVKIIIDPLPDLTLSKTNDVDCTTGTTRLTAEGASSYQWSPASTLDNPNIASPAASPLETTMYKVIAFNSSGCSVQDSISVYFTKTGISDFRIPNAFTPNRDGKNDVFKVISKGAAQLKQLAVFNRWGEMIFSTTDVNKGWDGSYKGVPQLADTYVWMLRYWSPCTGDDLKKGTVILIK